jgi:uncharacterized protein (UPF0332 family)
MKEWEKKAILVRYRISQVHDALDATRALINAELPRDAINRAYYSIFYSVLALLVSRHLGTSKHSGALALVNLEFVKTGLLSADMARLARRAFDRRQEADYAELITVTRDEASTLCQEAAGFVKEVEAILVEYLE